MALLTKKLNFKILSILLAFLITNLLYADEANIEHARQEFLSGNYKESIGIANRLNTIESKIFQSRAISVYAHFFLEDDIAKRKFLDAYQIMKKLYSKDLGNAEVYIEAAHALGRYGQKIGIMAAITEGIADRVKNYLDKALKINDTNMLANLSKGLWHAEIVNQAGRTLAKAVYGADIKKAREHFTKAYNKSNNEISILYELAYGYSLLGTDTDLLISKKYLNHLLTLHEIAHIDKFYKDKALKLKNNITP